MIMRSSDLNGALQSVVIDLRKRTGLGVVTFSNDIGINGVWEYEAGRRTITLRVLFVYSNYFNIPVSEIVKMAETAYANKVRHNEK